MRMKLSLRSGVFSVGGHWAQFATIAVILCRSAYAAAPLPSRADYVALCEERVRMNDTPRNTAENHYRIGWCRFLEKGQKAELQRALESFETAYRIERDPRFLQMRFICMMVSGDYPRDAIMACLKSLFTLDDRYQYFEMNTAHPEVSYLVLLLSDQKFCKEAAKALEMVAVDEKSVGAVFMHLKDPQYHGKFNFTVDGPKETVPAEYVELSKFAARSGNEGLKAAREWGVKLVKWRKDLRTIQMDYLIKTSDADGSIKLVENRAEFLDSIGKRLDEIFESLRQHNVSKRGND